MRGSCTEFAVSGLTDCGEETRALRSVFVCRTSTERHPLGVMFIEAVIAPLGVGMGALRSGVITVSGWAARNGAWKKDSWFRRYEEILREESPQADEQASYGLTVTRE